ncbi:AraC family transcriptional regulator [Stappia sp. ES.058]|uniref:AraC-like transcriptional regulator QhpR n=1 Tax=Stappia sp. ES.058 TaxID=1881061 RepID=UPI00087DB5FD|nr:AraC family transcriptional regulator [Stappia sp. ES.058]SDT94525.1 AraC-type DNA-binding protein [Stappia sp. ES.058]
MQDFTIPEATIGAAALPLIANAMQKAGVDAARAFADSGLGAPPDTPVKTSGELPLAQFTRLLQAGGAQAPDAGRMWCCGEAIAAPALAGLFPACLGATHLGDLLDRLLADLETLQHGTAFHREVAGDTCILSYRIIDPAIWPRSRDAEFTLAFLDAVVRRFGSAGLSDAAFAVGLSFEHERDSHADLARMTGVAPLFGEPCNMLAFPARLLDLPVRVEHPLVSSLREATPSRATPEAPVSDIVEAVYRRLGQGPLTQETIANDCGLSQRSLRRRLDRAGCTFRALTDDARTQYALWALRETRLPVSEIAHRLGYDSQGAFARAFRRSTGKAPSGVRGELEDRG